MIIIIYYEFMTCLSAHCVLKICSLHVQQPQIEENITLKENPVNVETE